MSVKQPLLLRTVTNYSSFTPPAPTAEEAARIKALASPMPRREVLQKKVPLRQRLPSSREFKDAEFERYLAEIQRDSPSVKQFLVFDVVHDSLLKQWAPCLDRSSFRYFSMQNTISPSVITLSQLHNDLRDEAPLLFDDFCKFIKYLTEHHYGYYLSLEHKEATTVQPQHWYEYVLSMFWPPKRPLRFYMLIVDFFATELGRFQRRSERSLRSTTSSGDSQPPKVPKVSPVRKFKSSRSEEIVKLVTKRSGSRSEDVPKLDLSRLPRPRSAKKKKPSEDPPDDEANAKEEADEHEEKPKEKKKNKRRTKAHSTSTSATFVL
jgi:hypothetical protein